MKRMLLLLASVLTAAFCQVSAETLAMKATDGIKSVVANRKIRISDNKEYGDSLRISAQMKASRLSLPKIAKAPVEDDYGMITDPGVPVENWVMKGYVGSLFGNSWSDGNVVRYAREGNEIYLHGLVPSDSAPGYVKGIVQDDGKTVVFPMDQVVDYWIYEDSDDEYVFEFTANKIEISEEGEVMFDGEMNEEGEFDYNWTDAVATIQEDGSISFEGYLLAAWSYQLDGWIANVINPVVYPLWNDFVDQPSHVENAQEYVFYSTDEVLAAKRPIKVNAFKEIVDGKEYLWVQGVCVDFPEGYIRGEIEGNSVSFSMQHISDGTKYFELFPANNIRIVEEWVPFIDEETGEPMIDEETGEEYGYMNYYLKLDECDSMSMTIGEENGEIILMTGDEGYAIAYYNLVDGMLSSVKENIRYVLYEGDRPAEPMAPYDIALSWSSYLDDENNLIWCVGAFGFTLLNCDKDGNYINPDKLGWEVFADDELYTFTTEKFPEIESDMTLVPYGFVDIYDFFWLFYPESGTTAFPWPESDMCEKWGVRSVYTVDGVTNYSPIVYADLSEHISGVRIMEVSKEVKSVVYHNIAGLTSDRPFRNQFNIVETTYSDGSVKIEKTIIR